MPPLYTRNSALNVNGVATRPIQLAADGWAVEIIDQTQLPHHYALIRLENVGQCCRAITQMQVRGAPLIGATAAYGMALALRADATDNGLVSAYQQLHGTRPTAINLRWALDKMTTAIQPLPINLRAAEAYQIAADICTEDVARNSAIGDHGLAIIQQLWEDKGKKATINILTHCNAGWLATVDWGTATAAIYKAHNAGIPIHVWVDETRPRNQGASLTAWELGNHGVPYTLIVDNAGGHLMQHGAVDLCLMGTDRTTRRGDVCNKIGTYLKALAAYDNHLPFYVALPSPTIDWHVADGLKEIVIEQRDGREITQITGLLASGDTASVCITPPHCRAVNYAFDVTPAKYITGLLTERGLCEASECGLTQLFPEQA